MVVKCSSCNGIFENTEAFCPFCDSINLERAEEEYLEELEEIVENLEELPLISQKEIGQEIRKTAKKHTKLFFASVLCFGIFLISISAYFLKIHESPYTDEQEKAQILWEKETFPILDQWYAEGNYEEIIKFHHELRDDENNLFYLYNWDPMLFIYKYLEYQFFLEAKTKFEASGIITEEELTTILFSTLNDTTFYLSSKEEQEKIKKYREEQYVFLVEEFHFSAEELQQIKEKAMEIEIFDRDICAEVAKERCEEMT